MLENLNTTKEAVAAELQDAITSASSPWDQDDEIAKILRKKRKKIQRLKKRVKKKHGARKKNKKKIKSLKKQIKELQNEKERQAERLKTQLLQARHQNELIRLYCLLQLEGGKQYLMKHLFQYYAKGGAGDL